MEFLFLVQARSGSTRFKRKIFEKLFLEKSLLDIVLHRLTKSNYINNDNLVILTTDSNLEQDLVELLKKKQFNFYRGDEHNVFKRFYDFLKSLKDRPDYIFRICSDNPFIEPTFIDEMVNWLKANAGVDYLSFSDHKNNPAILTHYGFFCEAIKTETFLKTWEMDLSKVELEHVTPVFYRNEKFTTHFLRMPETITQYPIRLTIDTEEDIQITKQIFSEMKNLDFNFNDVIKIIEENKTLLKRMELEIEKNRK